MKKLYFLPFLLTASVHSQIIFTEIAPDSVVTGLISPATGDAYFLDMDNNGTDDYELVKVTDPSWDFAYMQSGGTTPGMNEVIASMGAGIREVHHLDSGDVIDAAGPWELVTGGNLQFVSDFLALPPPTGLWVGEADGYFGVRFDSLGTTYYGWARFGIASDNSTMTIKSYAYESSGGSIVAGNYPVAITPCLAPTALNATSITINSANLGWTENNAATEWQIQHGAAGFTIGTGTIVDVTTNPYALGGLSDFTTYDFYVRSICGAGDTSAWSLASSFTTLIDDAGITGEQKPMISVYPNPAMDQLTIKHSGSVNTIFTLVDLSGRTILNIPIPTPSTTIDLNGVSTGIYVWSVSSESGQQSGRQVIR